MPMILALVSLAWADRVYWVRPPEPADLDSVGRTLPGAATHPIDDLVGDPSGGDGARAVEALRAELAAVRPLLAEFDGELQIMARLRKATSDITELRSPEDAELLWQALCFEGNAVHRYFGDRLGSDPAAAPYRGTLGPAIVVRAWIDAVALKGPASPGEADIPEKPQRLSYDGVRALMQAMPSASLEIGRLASGAEVVLDGRVVDASPGSRTLLVPGRHFVTVRVGDVALLHGDAELPDGATMKAEAPFGPQERDDLVALAARPAGWAVPAAALVPIQGAKEPVYLATPGKGHPRVVRVDRGTAEAVALVAPPAAASSWSAHAAVGAGWVSTGDFYVLHVAEGAPHSEAAVNAPAAAFLADGEWRGGLFAASVGVSGQVALGEFHSLPSGTDEVRGFVYPHVGVGLPWVQATVGPLFPWYLGVGVKARAPLVAGLELAGSALYGAGLTQPRADGSPDYAPLPLYAAWGGVGWAFR